MKNRGCARIIAWMSAVLVVLVTGCAGSGPALSPSAAKPRLIVFLVVDGLPQSQVVDYRDQLAPDGLQRFLQRGAWFSQAHYGHAYTVTAAGHATMLTGAYPHRTGIIGNEWVDPATGQTEYCTGDTSATYIGHKTERLDGTSPKNLRAETVGDVLRQIDPQSKVIAISGKDRGAILPAGRLGTAYMYQGQTGQFASSSYYMKAHPQWVNDFHAVKPADKYFMREWQPLLPPEAYTRSQPDDRPWYRPGGKLPKTIGGGQKAPGPAFYAALLPSPFSDALTLDFARAAIAGEGLGQDTVPDILAVSLSGHDYINHAYGAESRLSHDHVLHLDRLLQSFFADLDATVGKDNYVAVLTADHGFMPAPEYSQSLGRDAGRVDVAKTMGALNEGLSRRFGAGQWATAASAHGVLLNRALIAERKVDRDAVAAEGRTLLLAQRGIAFVYTRAELESGKGEGPFFASTLKTWHRELSADLQVGLKPYWMFGTGSVATHGSPYEYDTHVPLLMYGPQWIQPGRIDARVEIADIAPTLSRIVGVRPPAQSEGSLLPIASPRR